MRFELSSIRKIAAIYRCAFWAAFLFLTIQIPIVINFERHLNALSVDFIVTIIICENDNAKSSLKLLLNAKVKWWNVLNGFDNTQQQKQKQQQKHQHEHSSTAPMHQHNWHFINWENQLANERDCIGIPAHSHTCECISSKSSWKLLKAIE